MENQNECQCPDCESDDMKVVAQCEYCQLRTCRECTYECRFCGKTICCDCMREYDVPKYKRDDPEYEHLTELCCDNCLGQQMQQDEEHRDMLRNAAARIDLTGESDAFIAEHLDLINDIAEHRGGTLDLDTILALRAATGVMDIGYDLYHHINSRYDDLFDTCQNIIDGNDPETLVDIMRDIMQWTRAQAWDEGAESDGGTNPYRK